MRVILKTHHEMASKTKAIIQPDEIDPSTACRYPKKQLAILRRLSISYKGPLIFLIVFSLILVPLLPGEDTNPVILNEIRTKSYRPLTLIQTVDGGFALAGEVDLYGGTGGFAFGKGIVTDMWLMKIDANGLAQWHQTYGGAGCETASTLVQTAEGGFLLAGATSTYSTGDYMDIWLVKTDANGVAQWNQTHGGPGWDEASTLVQTAEGGFALTGWLNRFSTGGDDMWLMKTDANGVAQWNQTYGEIDRYGTTTLVQTEDGGFALASSTNSFGTGDYDMWLVKTDAKGTAQWNQTYGEVYYDGATALVQTTDGGFAVAGYTNVSNLDNYILGYAFSDMGLVKTDANGVAQWNQTYGGLGWEDTSTLVQTVDGGFALACSTTSYGSSYTDMWLVKTDANGAPQWNQTYGGAHITYYKLDTLLIQTADGGFALTGNTGGAGTSSDMLLVKTDAKGDVQWSQLYDAGNLKATTIVNQKTSGLGTPSLLVAIVVLIIARRLIYEKKR